MNVIIVGAGIVGRAIASHLSQEHHRVAIVDSNREIIDEVNETLDVLAKAGRGDLPSVLESVGIAHADMVIAVTSEDAVNVMVGMLAHAAGVKHRIVRIRNTEYKHANIPFHDLGIDHWVDPEEVIVESLLSMLQFPSAYEYASLSENRVQLIGLHVRDDAPVVGVSMADLRASAQKVSFLVISIARNGRVIVPGGDDTISVGDNVHVLVKTQALSKLAQLFGTPEPRQRRVVIAGASRIGWRIAASLTALGKHVCVIESDPKKAENLARAQPNVLVLQGSPQMPGVQDEAGVDRCDVFCALTTDEQVNMTSTLLAQKKGADRTVALVNEPEFVGVLEALGVDIVLNPRLTVIGEILQHLRRGHVYSVKRFCEGQAELIDFEVGARSKALNETIRGLKLPKEALVGAIVRGEEVMIPKGNTTFTLGDRVLMFCLPSVIHRVESLF